MYSCTLPGCQEGKIPLPMVKLPLDLPAALGTELLSQRSSDPPCQVLAAVFSVDLSHKHHQKRNAANCSTPHPLSTSQGFVWHPREHFL